MKARLWRAFAVVAGAMALSTTLQAQTKAIKVITSLPTLTVAVPFTVLANGYDKAHGLSIETQQAGGSSSLQIDAVLSGNAMFGTPGTPTALQAIREGADLRIVAAVANNQLATVINNDTMKKLGVAPTAPIADRFKALNRMRKNAGRL